MIFYYPLILGHVCFLYTWNNWFNWDKTKVRRLLQKWEGEKVKKRHYHTLSLIIHGISNYLFIYIYMVIFVCHKLTHQNAAISKYCQLARDLMNINISEKRKWLGQSNSLTVFFELPIGFKACLDYLSASVIKVYFCRQKPKLRGLKWICSLPTSRTNE